MVFLDIESPLSLIRSLTFTTRQPQDMMEHSQVRCAIPLSFIPLKVRRMKSRRSVASPSDPDCRLLMLYWVSAKALTLPISHHGSSQLSLPSGFIPSWRDQHTLCVHFTLDRSLLGKKADLDLLCYHPFGPVACIATSVSSWVISRYCVRAGQRRLAFYPSWEFIVVRDGHLVIWSSGASGQTIVILPVRD